MVVTGPVSRGGTDGLARIPNLRRDTRETEGLLLGVDQRLSTRVSRHICINAFNFSSSCLLHAVRHGNALSLRTACPANVVERLS